MRQFLLGTFLLLSMPVYAGDIMAIVGDAPISKYDVEQRITLMGIQQPSLVLGVSKEQLSKQVLDVLVDEQVKGQTAVKEGFSVTEEDIKQAVARLEQQNGLDKGALLKELNRKGVQPNTLYMQVKADLLWLKVLEKNKENLSAVTDGEIAKREDEIKKEMSTDSYLPAEIVVPTLSEANQVIAQLKNGVSFAKLAAQKSKAASAATEGLAGWVNKDNYPADLMKTLKKMQKGELSAPIKTKDGYAVLYLVDKQDAVKDGQVKVWDLAQIATEHDKTVSLIPAVLSAKNCQDFLKTGEQKGIKEALQRGFVNPNQVPAELSEKIAKQKTAAPLGPIQTPNGDLFFMKCGEKTQSLLPSKEEIKSILDLKKMEALSDKLLKRAKRYAVIEYK